MTSHSNTHNSYPETSPLFNQDAIDTLKEAGYTYQGTELRRRVLGCLACQWNKGKTPEAVIRQVAQCLGTHAGTLYAPFHALEASGAVTKQKGPRRAEDPGNPPWRFSPSDTEVGRAFSEALVSFEQCKLPQTPQS